MVIYSGVPEPTTNHAGILSPALKHPRAVRGTQTGQLRVGATGGQSVCAAAVRVHAHGFVVVRQGSHLRAILKVGPDDAVTVLQGKHQVSLKHKEEGLRLCGCTLLLHLRLLLSRNDLRNLCT